MQQSKKITFFMLVTNRDCIIADYAIRSYAKIYSQERTYGYNDFVLFIYLNCLSNENKEHYLPRWKLYPFTVLYDNSERIQENNHPYPGQEIISPEGIVRTREDYTENCDELWTTELKKFYTPYVATVDADFEVLHPDFYFNLMGQLEGDENLIGASSSYEPTYYRFDSYSARHVVLNERNHTWFCIYRKKAFTLSHASHFYYEEVNQDGRVSAYDSSAYFQHDLRKTHHLNFATLPGTFRSSFVHYGAASKNKSLTRKNIGFYRRIFLLSAVGIIYGEEKNWIKVLVNKAVRKTTNLLFGRYLDKMTRERSTYIHN